MANSTICTVTVDDRDFEASRDGDVLRIAPVGSEELAETVSVNHLPDAARTALDNGDVDNAALQQAVEGIARAIADRGA